jgi:hypothetical protein
LIVSIISYFYLFIISTRPCVPLVLSFGFCLVSYLVTCRWTDVAGMCWRCVPWMECRLSLLIIVSYIILYLCDIYVNSFTYTYCKWRSINSGVMLYLLYLNFRRKWVRWNKCQSQFPLPQSLGVLISLIVKFYSIPLKFVYTIKFFSYYFFYFSNIILQFLRYLKMERFSRVFYDFFLQVRCFFNWTKKVYVLKITINCCFRLLDSENECFYPWILSSNANCIWSDEKLTNNYNS